MIYSTNLKKANQVVDDLSRRQIEDDAILISISSPVLNLVTQLKEYYKADLEGQNLINKVQTKISMQIFFDDLLYFKDRIYIPYDQ